MQQYDYEVRHLSGKLNAEADSMSRIFEHLHLSNLFATAPTSEQADLERTTGITASSTRLCENSEQDFEKDFQPCDEGDHEVCDREGGLDSVLFSAHLASENFDHQDLQAAALGVLTSNDKQAGYLLEKTFEALKLQGKADWTMFCNGVTEEDTLKGARQATWEESADEEVAKKL